MRRLTVNGRDRGATLPLVALALPVLILMTAFAVDLGRQRALRRDLQAGADVIALDLVRLIDTGGATPAVPTTLTALNDSLVQNGYDAVTAFDGSDGVTVEWGHWEPPATPQTECPRTIVTQPPSCFTAGVTPTNAVEVTLADDLDYFFQPGQGGAVRSAIASTGEDIAEFGIGSFGANLSSSNQGLLNSILTPLLGHPAGLSVLSYQGLAGASIGIGDLGAELGLLTPWDVLNTEVPFADAMLAAANVLAQGGGNTATVQLLRDMFGYQGAPVTAEIGQLPPITLGDLVAAMPGAEGSALAADVNLLDLLTTGVFASQCTNPDDLSTCSALNLPGLNLGIPGLLNTTASLRVVQGQVRARGPVGTEARTNQTQLDLSMKLGAQEVGKCKPVLLGLNCLLGGLLGGLGLITDVDAVVELNASVKLAQGIGTIAAIECPEPFGLDVSTQTGLYDIDLSLKVDFGKRGLLGGLLGALIGSLTLAGETNQLDIHDSAAFTIPPDVFGVTTQEVGHGSVGLSDITLQASGTGVLGELGNIGINYTVGKVLSVLVNPLLHQLDNLILGPLTDLLGVNVVGADVTPYDVECGSGGVKLVG